MSALWLCSYQCTPCGQAAVLQHQSCVGGPVHLWECQSCQENSFCTGAEPRYYSQTCNYSYGYTDSMLLCLTSDSKQQAPA